MLSIEGKKVPPEVVPKILDIAQEKGPIEVSIFDEADGVTPPVLQVYPRSSFLEAVTGIFKKSRPIEEPFLSIRLG